MGDVGIDEHCQRLSITVPEDSEPSDRLPVMVWIHGGSYTTGAGDAPIFDPAALVREQQVVVVAVTYRLGLLGFLGSRVGTPANLGLLDQVAALRWVSTNIAAFGGDPTNVTVFGQSAGGDAVAHLMIAEGTEGLFRRAIIQSAPLGISRRRAEMTAAMAAEAALVSPDSPVDQVVAAKGRVEASAARYGLRAAMPFGTQYGFHPLPPEDEVDQAWERVAPRIDVLIGHTDREAAFFVPVVPAAQRLAGLPVVGRLAGRAVVAGGTWRVYGASAAAFARRHRRGGGHGYRYRLVWGAPGNPFAGAHTTDLPLLFGDEDVWRDVPLVKGATWAEINARGRELRAIWAGFARTGDVDCRPRDGLISLRRL